MFSYFVLAGVGALALAAPSVRAESHNVQITNNCGSGNGVFLYQGDGTPGGSRTINGQVLGGVAWIDGFAGADCQSSGVNCGIVEFTLSNPSNSADPQNAADYSLLDGNDPQTGAPLGNHQYTYPMEFAFTGSCTSSQGQCTGDSASQCPGAYLGSDTTGGAPTQCVSDDAGVSTHRDSEHCRTILGSLVTDSFFSLFFPTYRSRSPSAKRFLIRQDSWRDLAQPQVQEARLIAMQALKMILLVISCTAPSLYIFITPLYSPNLSSSSANVLSTLSYSRHPLHSRECNISFSL